MDTVEYKWVGTHVADLADGRMMEIGQTVELSAEDVRHPHNETLITSGGLIPVNEEATHEATLAKRRETRRETAAGKEDTE